MNDVRKLFNRRSLGNDGAGSSSSTSSRFRRRSKSKPRQTSAGTPHDDPLTSAYSQSGPSSGDPANQAGEYAHEEIPRNYGHDSSRYGQSASSLPDASGQSSSAQFDEDVARRNRVRNAPPVPQIPQSAISSGSRAVSDGYRQQASPTEEYYTPHPIADEFSSASYYTRQNSPLPTLSTDGESPSLERPSRTPQQTPYTTPQPTPAVDFSAANNSPAASTPRSTIRTVPQSLDEDPIMVGSTAAGGTRNAPNYAEESPSSARHNKVLTGRYEHGSPMRKALPFRGSGTSEATRSSTMSPLSSAADSSSRGISSSSTAPTSNSSTNAISSKLTQEPEDLTKQRGLKHSSQNTPSTGADEPPSLEGILDLSNTEETIVHRTQAPAVVHETVHTDINHVRHDVAQRDIHTHDIQHRVLPINDVQVLPARHYAPAGPNGELVEIEEADVPGITGQNQPWIVNPKGEVAIGKGNRDKVISRRPEIEDGDEKRYVNASGVPTTETTWIHQPQYETGRHGHRPNEPRSSSTHPDHARDISGSTLNGNMTAIQSDHERRGEEAVAAGRARGATVDFAPLKNQKANAKFAAKSRPEQEGSAAAAMLAARRATHHVPGSFVE